MTDIEILEKILIDHDDEYKLMLWNRYQGKVYKMYHRNRPFFKKFRIDYEDYVSESWIYFELALRHFDLDKMKESGCKSFSTFFHYYLMRLKTTYERRYKHAKSIDLFSEVEPNDAPETVIRKGVFLEGTYEVDEVEEIRKAEAKEFVQNYALRLNPREQEIVTLYLNNRTIKEIAESLDCKYRNIYNFLKRVGEDMSKEYKKSSFIGI